ncbi:ABC transporter permease [Telmatobacter sp. DSM 110680]|uniref:ABC transporter permease n=1 Tax=Telmatobacter sp. DSM 110680 TaxID=3036704 RepID=A0AAU7DQA7_9BACT
MSWFLRWRSRWSSDRRNNELDEELKFHLAMREQWNVDRGMRGEPARREARLRFGNPTMWRERMREIDWIVLPQSVLQDVKYGLRTIRRNARFTAVAVIALAIGIGINTTIFTAYKGLLGRGVDARDPGSMVSLTLLRQSGEREAQFSYPDYEAYKQQSHTIAGLVATGQQFEQLIMSDAGGSSDDRKAASDSLLGKWGLLPAATIASKAELASVITVSENYFSVLGIAPVRGRFFVEQDRKQLAAAPAVLISENYWQKRFGGDPEIIGKAIRLNGAAVTIIGITPRDFVGTSIGVPDFWVPLSLQSVIHPGDQSLKDEDSVCCRLFGRIASDASVSQVRAEMSAIAARQFTLHKSTDAKNQIKEILITPASPFPRELDRGLRFAIFLIMLATAMVLVIACANVASLQLARAASRQIELAVRISLGASRRRLIRQLLTESALLGLIAGAVAILCSWAMLRILAKVAKDLLPADMGTFIVNVNPDAEIFAYVFGISVIAGVLFGLAPTLESTRSALSSWMKANSGMSPARNRRLRDWLTGGQVAVSFVLLIAGSMMVRSAFQALTMSTGYETKHVVNLTLQYPEGPEYDGAHQNTSLRHIVERLETTPGVMEVATGRPPDGGGLRTAAIAIDGKKADARSMKAYLFYTYVDANYFHALGIPMTYGHGFHAESGVPEPTAVLSETAAQRLWPGMNPIGRTLEMSTDGQFHDKKELTPDGRSYQVIGIAHDARGVLMDNSDAAEVYLQIPENRLNEFPLLVRTSIAPGQLIHQIESTIASVNANIVATAYTLDDMLRETPPFMVSSMAALIAGTVGLLGLLLSAMGIYGTLSYVVVLRTREVGIRMALGARKGEVLRLMLRQSSAPVIYGILVGCLLATGDYYLLRKVLYGVGPLDALSYTSISALFLIVAVVASYVPARRATMVDPAVALRYE